MATRDGKELDCFYGRGSIKEELMMELTNEQRKKYSDFVAGIDLQKIFVREIKAKLNQSISVDKNQSMNVRLDQTANFRVIKEELYEIIQSWQLSAVAGDKRRPLLKIAFDFAVIIRSKEKLEQDIFQIYAYNNLTLNTWPFVRELINSITARMDLPPLTLPFFKSLGSETKNTSEV